MRRSFAFAFVWVFIACGGDELSVPTGAEAPLSIWQSRLTVARRGAAYAYQFSAEGGLPPYAWAVSAPNLPWLNIDRGGRLFSMVPPAAVSSEAGEEVTVTVTDARRSSVQKTFHLRVDCIVGERLPCFAGSAEILACVAGESACVGGRPSACEPLLPLATSQSVEACDADCRTCDESSANACKGGRCVCGEQPSCARGDGAAQQCCGNGDAATCVALGDARHCGSCENDCVGQIGGREHVDVACTAETYRCDYACSKGFGDCNGKLDDGCETNLSTRFDCGACGTVCGEYEICSSEGTCIRNPNGCVGTLPHRCPTDFGPATGICVALPEHCPVSGPQCPPFTPHRCDNGRCVREPSMCGFLE